MGMSIDTYWLIKAKCTTFKWQRIITLPYVPCLYIPEILNVSCKGYKYKKTEQIP